MRIQDANFNKNLLHQRGLLEILKKNILADVNMGLSHGPSFTESFASILTIISTISCFSCKPVCCKNYGNAAAM